MNKRTLESCLAEVMSRFTGVLRSEENVQQKVHDIIMGLNEDMVFTDEETKLTQKVLNVFLSFSFVLKSNEDDVDKFITYH